MPDPDHDMLSVLFRHAVWSGVPLKDFEGLPVPMILEASRIQQEKERETWKTFAMMIYNLASLITVGFHDPKHFPAIEEAFPQLFEAEKPVQQDWRIMKQRIEEFMMQKSAKHGS